MATTDAMKAGTVHIECPVCAEAMPAEVTCEITPGAEEGRVNLSCQPDMTDIWAHMWGHM